MVEQSGRRDTLRVHSADIKGKRKPRKTMMARGKLLKLRQRRMRLEQKQRRGYVGAARWSGKTAAYSGHSPGRSGRLLTNIV